MKKGKRAEPASPQAPWTVYLLECADRTLYTGVTNDLPRRLRDHESGKGARYTRGRAPFLVRYTEDAPTKSAALVREAAIKKLTRRAKLALISPFPGGCAPRDPPVGRARPDGAS